MAFLCLTPTPNPLHQTYISLSPASLPPPSMQWRYWFAPFQCPSSFINICGNSSPHSCLCWNTAVDRRLSRTRPVLHEIFFLWSLCGTYFSLMTHMALGFVTTHILYICLSFSTELFPPWDLGPQNTHLWISCNARTCVLCEEDSWSVFIKSGYLLW